MTRYLITSALPYINGIKHLGNLIGSLLPADVYARFLRQEGKDVLYICGTDEHGTPAEIAAEEAQTPITTYCEEMCETQKKIYEDFDISFDYFGRSSSPSNHQLTQDIFHQLDKNGFIQVKEIHQYYSHTDHRFLPDRYVQGTCPFCQYEKARGDQCDGCGILLDPTDLLHPFSALSGSRDITLQKTQHLFLDASPLEDSLRTWVENQPQWPDVVKGIAKKWLNEGIQPRCISRDLRWGIQVPREGFEGKVFYVWFDAPNAYISMTQDWARERGDPDLWKEWWLEGKDVFHTEFMAKDNVAFHAIFWPSILMGADMGIKQVDYIKGFHWLTYEKGKFSTSEKRGIFTDIALELYPSDYWRYYLLSHCPETADSDFSFALFASVINKDLNDILGNFVNRTLSLFQKYDQGKVPFSLSKGEIDEILLNSVHDRVKEVKDNLYALKFRQATQALRSLWVLGNEYITTKEPWIMMKTNPGQAKVCLVHCLHLLRAFAVVSFPFMPKTAHQILSLLNDPKTASDLSGTSFDSALDFSYFQKDHVLAAPFRLFEKIDQEKVQEIIHHYSGR